MTGQIITRLLFLTRKLGRDEKPVSQGTEHPALANIHRPEGRWMSALIPSTAKHWAVVIFFHDDINNRDFEKVVEVWDKNGKLKITLKDWNENWQKNWEVQTEEGENNKPAWTMIDKNLINDDDDLDSLVNTRIRYDSERLERFVKMSNDANYQYNTFTKNCQWFVDNLLLELKLKPIQRLLPWSLDFVVTFFMLAAATPFAYYYITRGTSFFGTPTSHVEIRMLLMLYLWAASWLNVFILREIFGPCKIKYLVMGWILIQCFVSGYYKWHHSIMYYNTLWVILLMLHLCYRFFRFIIYGNVLHYPKDYSLLSKENCCILFLSVVWFLIV